VPKSLAVGTSRASAIWLRVRKDGDVMPRSIRESIEWEMLASFANAPPENPEARRRERIRAPTSATRVPCAAAEARSVGRADTGICTGQRVGSGDGTMEPTVPQCARDCHYQKWEVLDLTPTAGAVQSVDQNLR